jgi:hypothetical protein
MRPAIFQRGKREENNHGVHGGRGEREREWGVGSREWVRGSIERGMNTQVVVVRIAWWLSGCALSVRITNPTPHSPFPTPFCREKLEKVFANKKYI